jgi:hypothetical protein
VGRKCAEEEYYSMLLSWETLRSSKYREPLRRSGFAGTVAEAEAQSKLRPVQSERTCVKMMQIQKIPN